MKKVVLLLAILCLFSSISHAVEIDPIRLEHNLDAGKIYSGTFKIKNPSPYTTQVRISTGEYRYVFSEGMMPPKQGKYLLASCENWFNFEKNTLRLEPGQTIEAKFTINVPRSAVKEYLCAVIFDEKEVPQKPGAGQPQPNIQVNIIPRFSIPVYISINGTQKISANISEMSASSAPQKGGQIISLTLENTGNVHIRPFGTLVILNKNGEVVKNLPIGKTLPIFPAYKERIPVICRNLPRGTYTAVATVEISKNNLIQKKTTFSIND